MAPRGLLFAIIAPLISVLGDSEMRAGSERDEPETCTLLQTNAIAGKSAGGEDLSPPGCPFGSFRLYGSYCAGTDLQCECNYCDDFTQNTRCANVCRVLNGYLKTPSYAKGSWEAQRNYNPVKRAGYCDCSWMAKNGGLGDDCKQCDDCAVRCRKANPTGTCPTQDIRKCPPGRYLLSGTYCAGKGNMQCDCNYCDDFKQNTPCANACRVMNGYYEAPPGAPTGWEAKRNYNPVKTAGYCDCTWMSKNGGLGDDCKQCDDCAVKCRQANPQGTCPLSR